MKIECKILHYIDTVEGTYMQVDIRRLSIEKCNDLIYEFSRDFVNDFEVQMMCKELNMLLDIVESNFKRAEKQLLKTICSTILMDYLLLNEIYNNIDYDAMRVHVELLKNCIIDGLEDRNVKMLTVKVAYGDIFNGYIIEYDNSSCIDELEEVPIWWESESNIYNSYIIYKNKYKGFKEHSIKALATATDSLKRYRDSNEGKELFSYNGIASQYAAVVEYELKRIISKELDIDAKDIAFYDAIKKIDSINSESDCFFNLSNEAKKSNLHWIRRQVRNVADHGERDITYEEVEKMYNILIFEDLLDIISGYLCKIYFINSDK